MHTLEIEGSHQINRFVQNPDNFAKRKAKYQSFTSASGGPPPLSRGKQPGKQRNIKKILDQAGASSVIRYSDNKTVFSGRPQTQGGNSILSGSIESRLEQRANYNASN